VVLAALASCAPGGRRLVVVSTDDVHGKTSPCGCHTPKGGLARRATFLDSLRAVRGELLVVDAGSFFPSNEDERDAGPYMLSAMARLGTQAAGVGASDLRFGYAFLREHARSAGVPLLCANLVRPEDGATAFEPGRVFRVGGVRVGLFGLLREDAELGPARDSLRVDSPAAAARRMVEELRGQGAQVVVLLSQLGQAGSESLAVQVPGIDLVVAGGGVPVKERAVRAGDAQVVLGGMQGWQVGLAEIALDGRGRVQHVDGRTVVLGPEVRNQPAMQADVTAFEDSLNATLRARQASFGPERPDGRAADHYVGMSNCIRCHASEYTQWRTTAHARAWATLVERKREATPSCVPCHVTGQGKPGGYRTVDDAARLANVQCEACHGMGSEHARWTEQGNRVSEATCRACHTDVTSPEFDLVTYRPHVVHDPPPGLRPLPETPARRLMREQADPHGGIGTRH